jgi:hypothetical protein
MIKSAELLTSDKAASLPADAFALRILTEDGSHLHKFPVTSAADTWLSMRYFEKNAHKLPQSAQSIAASNLKIAADRYGVEPTKTVALRARHVSGNLFVEGIDKVATQSVRITEETGQRYALGNKYPLFHEGHVKKAAQYFEDYYGQFDAASRHTFAKNVIERASELKVDIPTESMAVLRKVAGDRFGDILGTQIRMRKELLHDQAKKDELDKLASSRGDNPEAFAEALAKFDAENRLDRHYDRYLADAYTATYDVRFTKQASGYSWEDESTGLRVDDSDLNKLGNERAEKVKSYFGEILANELKKHGSAIFDSLPVDAKIVLAKIARGTL